MSCALCARTADAAAGMPPTAPKTNATIVRCIVRITVPSEALREVVFERELDAVNLRAEAVGKVLAAPELEPDAWLEVRRRQVEQIAQGVVPNVERVGRLCLGVVDVDPRIADGRCEPLVPGMVEERHGAEQRKRDTFDWRARVAGVVLDPDVRW